MARSGYNHYEHLPAHNLFLEKNMLRFLSRNRHDSVDSVKASLSQTFPSIEDLVGAEDEFVLKVGGLDADSSVLSAGEDVYVAFDIGNWEHSVYCGESSFGKGCPVLAYRTVVGDFVTSSRSSENNTNKAGPTECVDLPTNWVCKNCVNHYYS